MQSESLPGETTATVPTNSAIWFWAIAAFLAILYLIVRAIKNVHIPKKKLVDVYGVDKKTFNKWLQYFCADLVPDMRAYYKRRTVPLVQYLAIVGRLGDPNQAAILSKKQIVEHGEGTYYALRGCVAAYPSQFGLPSLEAYLSLKKFPPKVSQQMLAQFS